MKRKLISSVFALALLATVGFGVNKSLNSNSNLSDLALANIEALANSETPEQFTQRTDCIACMKKHSCSGKDGNTYSWAHHKNEPSHQ